MLMEMLLFQACFQQTKLIHLVFQLKIVLAWIPLEKNICVCIDKRLNSFLFILNFDLDIETPLWHMLYRKGVVIMSTLQDLWYGNIRPNENKVITDEEKELISLIARHHEALSSSLKKDDLIVFEKYVDCFTEFASLIECQAFEIGFKLAVKLLTEK